MGLHLLNYHLNTTHRYTSLLINGYIQFFWQGRVLKSFATSPSSKNFEELLSEGLCELKKTKFFLNTL